MPERKTSSLYAAIYSLVRQIPVGQVATYGSIARQVGCTARSVGFAMAALAEGNDVPWQRVINSQGKISPRTDGEGKLLQRTLLESEGIQFSQNEKVELKKYLWNAREAGGERSEDEGDEHL